MMRRSSLALGALAATIAANPAGADTVAFRPGFYAGGFVGWVESKSKPKSDVVPPSVTAIGPNSTDPNPLQDFTAQSGFGLAGEDDGFSGGALVGYSFIGQGLMFAIEGDLALTGMDKSTTLSGFAGSFNANYDDTANGANNDDIVNISSTLSGTASSKFVADGSIRARVGTEIGYGMRIFATAGLALGKVDNKATITKTDVLTDDQGVQTNASQTVSAISSRWRAGWSLGGGLDVALWGPWLARVEYRYIDLGTSKLDLSFADGSTQTVKFDDKEQVVRFGLVYAF